MNTVWCLFGIILGFCAAITAFLGGIWYQLTFKTTQGVIPQLINKVSGGKPIILDAKDVESVEEKRARLAEEFGVH